MNTKNITVEDLTKEHFELKSIFVCLKNEHVKLKNDNTELKNEHFELKIQNSDLKVENAYLKEQLDWFKRQLFGKKSEKIINRDNHIQPNLPGMEDMDLPLEEAEVIEKTISIKKRKAKDNTKISFPSDIPVKRIFLDIPEKDKICPETGLPLKKIGEEVSQKLAHEPGRFFIKEIVRPKYAYPDEEKGISIAELPETIIPKCKADDSFLAEIVVEKFADHLPLYRQSESFSRSGIYVSRKLLSQWIIKVGLALEPLYDVMLKKIVESGNIFSDESPVDIQAPGKVHQGYAWVLAGGREKSKYVTYHFKMSRSHKYIKDLLSDYTGILHSDKYGAYSALAEEGKIIWSPCWSHVRRKFFEAQTDPPFREKILGKIKELFELEEKAWTTTPEERLKIRKNEEEPIIDSLITLVKEKRQGSVLPKSKLKTALDYFNGLLPYLKNYITYDYARMDNNVAERAVRPLAIGRKNWMFFGSEKGAKAGCILLSLVQTCRNFNVNPREYLEDIFRKILGYSNQKLEELLPDQWLISQQNISNTKK